jgi:hypothetical protein
MESTPTTRKGTGGTTKDPTLGSKGTDGSTKDPCSEQGS